jgi:hypothetical protein
VHRTAHTTTVWTASAALETTGSDVTVGWIVRRYLPDTKIRNRPKSIHPPFKMGVSVAQSKFQCGSVIIQTEGWGVIEAVVSICIMQCPPTSSRACIHPSCITCDWFGQWGQTTRLP